ncbi:MAG: DoxX family protein [Chromatiales bacterium]
MMTTNAATTSAQVTSLVSKVARAYGAVARWLTFLAPVADLALRLYVANVFWKSGMTKIQSWDSTLQLFQYEYHVPLLSPTLAAYAGTFTELFFPVLLVLGLGGRFAAFVLFVFNIIAVISYPDLNPAGLEQHKVWGLMLFVLLLHGPGPLSIDHWLKKRLAR